MKEINPKNGAGSLGSHQGLFEDISVEIQTFSAEGVQICSVNP